MLPDGGFKRTQDLLGQLLTGAGIAKAVAIVLDFGQDLGAIAMLVADDGDRQNDAAGGTRQFGRSDGRGEGAAEEFDLDGGGGSRTIDEEGNGGALFEVADDFEEGEWVLLDDEGLDAPAGARSAAEFSQRRVGFFHGQGKEFHAVSNQEGRSEFPIPEVRGDKENPASAVECGEETVAADQVAEKFIDRLSAFEPEEVGELAAELAEEGSGCGARLGGITVNEREEILPDDFKPGWSEPSESSGGALADADAQGTGQAADNDEAELPEAGAIEPRRFVWPG